MAPIHECKHGDKWKATDRELEALNKFAFKGNGSPPATVMFAKQAKDIGIIKLQNRCIIAALIGLIITDIGTSIHGNIESKKARAEIAQSRQRELINSSQYYRQRDWVNPDEYAIDDDNHSAEFGTLDF